MKKNAFYTLLALLLWTVAIGQTPQMVAFDEIRQIADRNAQALWGDVHPSEPIPYYGFDDEIVAWRFNYSIGKPFPAKDALLEQLKKSESEHDKYNQWGGNNFGRILIGARENMPVLLEYSRCLSAEFALAGKLVKLSEAAFAGESCTNGKIYYLDHFNTWHQIISNGMVKYVCTSPTGGIVDESTFNQKKSTKGVSYENDDFAGLWNKYKGGFVVPTDGDKYINYHECMPFYDWSYGCSPTAAAMIFAWYDNRSQYVSSKYPYFVVWHFQRFDNVENETDYNVSNLQYDLALAMSTDTMTGSTQSYNIDNGMNHVANSQRGYSFDCVNRYTFLWTRLTDDIDDGKPLLVSIPGHSTAGVGYNGSSDMAITHYTHDPPDHLVWISRWDIDMITRVSSGGQKGSAIKLSRPVGDQRYNNNGLGEVYSEQNYAEITWISDNVPGSWVDLFYSTDGGHSIEPIVYGTENDGVYNWLIPAGAASTSCRIMANLRTPDMEPYIAGADGSMGNFIINNSGAIPTMVNEHIYTCDSLSEFFHFQHTEPSWAAIGAKSDFGNCNWEIQFFNNTNFNQTPSFYSTFGGFTNFMVVDGNHYPSSLRGIKIRPLAEHRTVELEYEGGNENLVFGANGPYNWNANEIVEMKEVHLSPGRYYFELEVSSGWPNLGMALFGSTDGQYLKHRYDYLAFADYTSGSQTESFNVTITQEDDYGLCIFSNRHEAGNYTIKIVDAFIWTGEVSTDWHDPDNWSGHLVPDISSKVVLTGDGHSTHISSADAACAQINILHDGRLYIDNHNLTVNGNVTLNGWLLITSAASRLTYYGDLVVNQYSYLEIATGAGIYAYGDWTFEENTNTQLNHGFVDFKGTSNSFVYSKSENSWFYDLKVSKTGGAFLAYDNCIGIEPLHIKNQFVLYNEAVFVQYAMYDVIFDGPFLSYAGSHFYFQNGTQRFERVGTGGISIFSESGSYFNDMVISVDDWVGLSSNIEIRGDLLIEDGMFKTLGYDVYIKGNWYNNSGFNHGNSRVIFNGTGIQEVTGTNFWELELNKSLGELRVHESTVSVQHYDWTQGTVRVNGGWFQLNDLEDAGIYGTVIVTSGQLDLHQEPDEYLDLNGNLQISGGEMNIYGGNGDSYWPFSANASFTMSDGVLDFKTNGLRIHNSASWTLNETITGGTVKIFGDLTVARTDFNPSGGTFYFYGYTEDTTLSVATGSNLFNLELDKSSKGAKAQVKTLTASGTLDLNGDFILTGGNFEAPAKMYVGGNFNNTQTHWHFDELTGEVVLDGSVDQEFNQEETFYKLTINKPGTGAVTVANDVTFTVLNTLLVDKGDMIFEPGSTLLLDGNFDVNYLGNIYFYGEAGNEITVTSASKSSYGFDVSAGGFISANNAIFNNMDVDGIYLHSGCYVDDENAFHGCTFAAGAPGGTLITWDNGADVVVHNAVFPSNSTGCTFNVKKTNNNGHVFFDLATGPFSGAAFESDPFSRIDWEYVAPLSLPFTENWNSSSFSTQNWVPEGSNWIISGAWGNPAPTADFHFYPRIYNYSVPLRSHLLNGTETSEIQLKYDIRLANYSTATLEQFKVQAVQQNGDFITLATYNNSGGSFGFITEQFDISDFADGEIFYLRFTAFGADSWNLDGWFVDNIMVSGIGPEPGKIGGFVTDLATGLPIENANIMVEGSTYGTFSNALGEYSIINLTPGTYNVTASAEGYEPAQATGIVVVSGETTLQNFALNPIPPTYCTEMLYSYGCLYGDGFDTFMLTEISNAGSGCSTGGYGDFTAMTATVSRGYPYQLSVSTNYPQQYVSVWVDFDDDFEFAASERIITDFVLANPGELYTTALTIPETAPTGTHRLRARTNWNETSGDACTMYDYGETEDYTIVVESTPANSSLKVFVTDGLSKGPVDNARIELVGTSWIGYTEEEGICIITGIVPGNYDMSITAENYEDLLLENLMIYAETTLSHEAILTPLAMPTHAIDLKTGWQGLSSYLMPVDTDIADIFYPLGSNLIIAQTMIKVYWPGQQVNTILTWEQHAGYKIKMLNDAILPINGYEEANKMCLLPEGWSILPVVCSENIPVATLFEGINKNNDVIIVKEIAGTGVYWPEMMINTLEILAPGSAYMILMENEGSVTFPENPEKPAMSSGKKEYPSCSPWNIPCQTPVSHLVAIPFSVFPNSLFSNGDMIGVFTHEGICCGMSAIGEQTVVTVFADDPLTFVKDGFYAGEKLFFRILNPETQLETLVDFKFDESSGLNSGFFVNEGVSVVSGIRNTSTTVFNQTDIQPEIYPNPTCGWVTVSNIQKNTSLIVFDVHGREVYEVKNADNLLKFNLEGYPKGVYMIKMINGNNVYSARIVVK